MANGPRVVTIGAGIVGCAVADELCARGWTDITPVTVEYFGDRHPAVVAGGPVVDPEMHQIRR